ncbi:hypothetical protein QR680_013707 [Steinernema hermaphroditum]|uniref:Uncharacterized protein n=1 Tax=Steinernema hermaphroditum TaxID=289476 RepID=A0AA39I8Q1_9BILA|nr:hypothetical protein QR680_013707 [Steinernema hermaphroditum]
MAVRRDNIERRRHRSRGLRLLELYYRLMLEKKELFKAQLALLRAISMALRLQPILDQLKLHGQGWN